MYHHHSQQQGPPHGPRPPHHQPPPNQHQNRPAPDMLSQVMGFQFPRPTQLPDELESALAIRGGRDMDHRLVDHMNRANQHQNQSSDSGIGQHGSYSSNPMALTTDNQPSQQQGVDWSSYQPPTKLFASPPPNTSHQPQRHQGPQQQPQSSHTGTGMQSWTPPVTELPSSQARHPHSGGGDGQGLYTPESAGSILASFGLSNEDLEVLSHYPDDQLTPDTLPFILRDIQINKSGNQKNVASTSTSSFSRNIHDMPLPSSRSSPLARSRSPEVPSLLTVTQTAGKVIDYGHASRTKEENTTRETFKREPLSSERTVKMYPSSSSTSSAPKADKAERRQVRLEHTESSKHGDRDYRRTSSDHRKSNRSPGRDFPSSSSKSRNLDRDYRRDGPKLRPSSETRSEASSRRSLSSSSGSKPHSSSKKLPTPTMISDFSAVSPKVYPHTCSLCNIQCDQEKDWVDHINTVNHTAACRDLRNKYPDWKPNLPSRSGRYGSRALWDPRDGSPSHSMCGSRSCSPTPSPPHSKNRAGPYLHRPHGRPYSPNYRHQHYTGGSSRSGVKRPHDNSAKFPSDSSRHPSFSKVGYSSKHGPPQASTKTFKSMMRPGTKATKTTAKPQPAKKKKKLGTLGSQDSSVADRLVYLTGIPKDATEQEVTDLVGSFGKINNVILMPCSEEESEKGEGQKASVCMVKAEDAQALATSTDLSIRDQQITALVAKKSETGPSNDANSSKPAADEDKGAVEEDSGGEADQKTSDEKGVLLITGLPESGWSESDIIKLVHPFGTPSDIILATKIGKALVSVPDMEIAQEIVKVNTFMPMKINNSELKMIHLKQCITLTTPVALYNLLIGSVDPLESPVPVGWSSLLVIRNVPNTPAGSSEVQKLVRRFGTVIKTLELSSMVICEMATAAMALSVYKRFQAFPCIIQNNPLFFSRKPDPKANTQTKVITAYLDSSEDTPANGKGSQKAAAAEEEMAHKEDSECPLEGMEKDSDGKDEKMKSEKRIGEDEDLRDNGSKDTEIIKDELTNTVSDSFTAPDAKPKADLETKEKSAVEIVMEAAEETKSVDESKVGDGDTQAGEDTKTPSSDAKAVPQEMAMPQLPKVTQEMVNALLVECRTRTASHPNSMAFPTNGNHSETQMETDQHEKAAEETKEPAKIVTEEEQSKKQERERKERELEEELDAFPFNMSDFVTLDEVGDVTDLPHSPSPTVPMQDNKNAEGGEDDPTSVPKDAPEDVTTEIKMLDTTVTLIESDQLVSGSDPVTVLTGGLVSSDLTAGVIPTTEASHALASQSDSSQTQTQVAACEPEALKTETTQTATLDSISEVGPCVTPAPAASTAPADSCSNSPAAEAATAESEEDEKENSALNQTKAKGEEIVVVTDRTVEHEKMQDGTDKETGAPAADLRKLERSETNTEESEKEKLKTETQTRTDNSLPPFDPSKPVGMEFLLPKTGFFCKVCNRFFTGAKEAEINHCKTLKHYDNLQLSAEHRPEQQLFPTNFPAHPNSNVHTAHSWKARNSLVLSHCQIIKGM
ncbi:zinc finger protein 638-like [Acanthopagrus latus]|uniref:zinc finger protein 638-like n=1 Tax=Acanthopagrus latus TaxID=8177 RepID=UPI00187C27FD|nr:zinc finger protein 638-like [Acanthopagrus latus]